MSDLGKRIAESIAKRMSEGPKKRKYDSKVVSQQEAAEGIKKAFEGKKKKKD